MWIVFLGRSWVFVFQRFKVCVLLLRVFVLGLCFCCFMSGHCESIAHFEGPCKEHECSKRKKKGVLFGKSKFGRVDEAVFVVFKVALFYTVGFCRRLN